MNAVVPKGSVLGPLLSLTYIIINDIADNLTDKARLFADDTSLSYSSSDLSEIEIVFNDGLEKLKVWANKWLIMVGRTGAVVSVADYGPMGAWFKTWPRHSLLWP